MNTSYFKNQYILMLHAITLLNGEQNEDRAGRSEIETLIDYINSNRSAWRQKKMFYEVLICLVGHCVMWSVKARERFIDCLYLYKVSNKVRLRKMVQQTLTHLNGPKWVDQRAILLKFSVSIGNKIPVRDVENDRIMLDKKPFHWFDIVMMLNPGQVSKYVFFIMNRRIFYRAMSVRVPHLKESLSLKDYDLFVDAVLKALTGCKHQSFKELAGEN